MQSILQFNKTSTTGVILRWAIAAIITIVAVFGVVVLQSHATYAAPDTYSCGTYGAGNYSENDSCPTGSLANTGQDLLWPVIAGVGLILLGAGVVFWTYHTRKKGSKQDQTTPAEEQK